MPAVGAAAGRPQVYGRARDGGGPGARTAGCGSASRQTPRVAIPSWLLAQARTIGAGERFHPPATGPLLGPCRAALGPAHRGPRRAVRRPTTWCSSPPGSARGRRARARPAGSSRARCYGALVTLDPTGVVLRPRRGRTLTARGSVPIVGPAAQRARGSRLQRRRAGTHVTVFIDGRAWRGAPGSRAAHARTPRSCSRSARTCRRTASTRSRRCPEASCPDRPHRRLRTSYFSCRWNGSVATTMSVRDFSTTSSRRPRWLWRISWRRLRGTISGIRTVIVTSRSASIDSM